MKPPPFKYIRPTSIEEALAAIANNEDAKVLTGGQSLIPMMGLRVISPSELIDMNGIIDLAYIKETTDEIQIGAMTRHNDVKASALVAEHCPLLTEAYNWIAHQAVRNRGTIGGNIFHADPASENPAVMLTYDAVMVLRSVRGEREVAARDFFEDIYEVSAGEDELLTEIRIGKRSGDEGYGFTEISPRKGDFAIVGVGAAARVVAGKFQGARIAACGVGPTAQRMTEAEKMLEGVDVNEDNIEAAAEAAAKAVDPFSDFHADAMYRRDLTLSLTRRGLSDAVQRATT